MDFSEEQLERYSRHILLQDVSVEGQVKIMNAKVLILGAGASHGHGVQTTMRPPLGCGFFTQSIPAAVSAGYEELKQYVLTILCLEPEAIEQFDIEEMYGRIEAAWWLADSKVEFLNGVTITSDAKKKLIAALGIPTLLTAYVHDVISFTTQWLLNGKTCPYHNRLAQDWLSPGDTVINFNYDQIMRWSLKDCTATDSVQLIHPHGIVWPSIEKQDPLTRLSKEPSFLQSIMLRDVNQILEGKIDLNRIALNDMKAGKYPSSIEEIEDCLTDYHKNLCIFYAGKSTKIVSPTPYKSLQKMKRRWGEVVHTLSSADEVVACGFSFRDLHFNEVFRQAMRNRDTNLTLTIVTRDKPAFKKVQEELHYLGIREIIKFNFQVN